MKEVFVLIIAFILWLLIKVYLPYRRDQKQWMKNHLEGNDYINAYNADGTKKSSEQQFDELNTTIVRHAKQMGYLKEDAYYTDRNGEKHY